MCLTRRETRSGGNCTRKDVYKRQVKDLTDDEVKRISVVIADSQTVEGDLRREIAMNIKSCLLYTSLEGGDNSENE